MRLRLFIFALAVYSQASSAYFQMDFLKAKSSGKASSQFTLADWLGQKGKASLADQWLALNRAGGGWFEFNPSAAHQSYKVKTTDASGTVSATKDSQKYTADMYLSILNLYGEYEKSSDGIEEYGGAAGLRLFGTSSQSTFIVARYGFLHRQNLVTQERWDNPYVEGQLQLYIIPQFGLNGQYRYFFPRESNQGTRLEGHRVTAGAFVEMGILRVFANYYQQPLKLGAGGSVQEDREGYEAGARFYF